MADALAVPADVDRVQHANRLPAFRLGPPQHIEPIPGKIIAVRRRDELDILRCLGWGPCQFSPPPAANPAPRCDVSRDVKQAETLLEQMPVYGDLPTEPVDEAAIEAKITTASTHNGDIEARRVRREQAQSNLDRYDTDIAELKARIVQLQEQLNVCETNRAELSKKIAEAEPLPEPIDVSEAQRDLADARETNRKIAAMKQRAAQDLLAKSLRKKVDDLTVAMQARAKEIADAFAAAEMPVPGLSFADGVVLFNGEPFDQPRRFARGSCTPHTRRGIPRCPTVL